MNCDEYRRWFESALKGELPPECPLEDYRRHLVSCPQCQLLLSIDDVAETIAEVAWRASATEDEAEGLRVVRLVRRRARRRKLVLTASTILVVSALLAAGIGAFHLFGSGPTSPAASPDAPGVGVSPEEFARALLNGDYGLRKARVNEKVGDLFLSFDRKDPTADQYEWAKRVLLSDLPAAFPSCSLFTVSIADEGECLLQVQIERGQLECLSPWHRELPGAAFCREVVVLFDKQGLATRTEDEE